MNNQADLWSSGKIKSDQSTNVYYQGKPLTSRQDCWWQVRTWDKDGLVSGWSEPASWSMGLLRPDDWKAQWISAPLQGEEALPKLKLQGTRDLSALPYTPPSASLLLNHLACITRK